ncbi:MAG: hypothetical protein PWR27_1913 [Petroclostridium sp.]|uniref:hypothetical protein n=1 Tax=Petroclostridium xylanilyticum TaxID=1792311 RepID=UPI000B982C39|nr:hypothetical protein [Petroclostridium xylanilyticum]MBZ4645620.1 hypothetical protein [Clostridia bacterium]MDK2811204.1 hypothetical protein [Petroclostridium sp.]
MNNNAKSDNWITITSTRKRKDIPSEIKIDKNGNVFIDGELYDENKTKYKNLSVSVEKYNKLNTGEETRKMIEQQKKASKGETAVITDIQEPNKTERTTVKY